MIGHREWRTARDVDPLVVGDDAAVDDFGVDGAVVGSGDAQFDGAVVEQDGVPPAHVLGEAGEGDRGARLVPLALVGGQREMAARVQFGLPALEDAETDLRALGVEQGGDGQAQLFAQAADRSKVALWLSWEPWEKLKRATSMPAQIRL